MKDVDLGEPTSFCDHVNLVCTQRDCETSKDIVDNYRNMFESRISAGATEKLPCSGKLTQTSLHGPLIWKVMQRNVWKDIGSWRTKQLSTCIKSQRQAWMTIILKNKKMSQENYILYAHKRFWNVFFLARIGRPDILWSVNKLARAVTKWTRACEKRLARLISYIHHTCESKQCHLVGNTAQTCRSGLFQDSDFCRRSWGLKIDIRRTFVHIWKSYISSNKLDLQETNICFTQLNRSWDYFAWCGFYA